MKTKELLLSASFAIGAMAFTACSSDADLAVDPVEEEPRGVVKTEFTISFPQKVAGTTRMSAQNVQTEASFFRGIQSIELYPFTADSASIGGTTNIPSKVTLAGGSVGLAGASGSADNSISNDKTGASYNALYQASNSHLYQNVDIPIGTKAFMFYGVAPSGGQTADVVGLLEKSVTTSGTQLKDITFSPKRIAAGGAVSSNGEAVAAYLTKIANTTTADGKRWAETPNVGLRTLYNSFTSIKTGAWRNVKAAVKVMYEDSLDVRAADNADTQAMKAAIKASIVDASVGVTASGSTLSFDDDKVKSYPADMKLPDGAAYVNWETPAGESAPRFVALADNTNTGLNSAPLSSYVYPADLRYRVISDIKTAKQSMTTYYNNSRTWKDICNQYDITGVKEGSQVTKDTRSIALLREVQYAVARLDVTVQAVEFSLKDNVGTSVSVGGTTFPVTGIIVGGQKAVDYKFQQSGSTPYTIYDQHITDKNGDSVYLTTTETNAVYTLALETAQATKSDDTNATVQIAVEFQNNSGYLLRGYSNQLIYPGCKFYLVGKLDPWSNSTQKDTNGNVIRKAFLQDYTTTARLQIKSLKNAYNTLPDLSVPKLELGLSVDLAWKDGIDQTIVIN